MRARDRILRMDFSPTSTPTVSDTVSKLIEAGCIKNVVGCSEADIARLESRYELKLPESYKEFLRLMGRNADGFHDGDSWKYGSLSWIRQKTEDLLLCGYDEYDVMFGFDDEWFARPPLPKTAFPFFMILAEVSYFFDTADGAEPAVCMFEDRGENFEKPFASFPAWLAEVSKYMLARKEAHGASHAAAEDEDDDDGAEDDDGADDGPNIRVTISWGYSGQEQRWANVRYRSQLYQFKEAGVIGEQEATRCSEEELDHLESELQTSFPYIYRVFLAQMGKGAGTFLADCQWRYNEIKNLRATAEETLKSANSEFKLSPTDFVFLTRNNDLFLYFDTANEDLDPPVYRFIAGEKQPLVAAKRFSEWTNTYRSGMVRGKSNVMKLEIEHPLDESEFDRSDSDPLFLLKVASVALVAILGVFSIPGILAHKALPALISDAFTSVLGTTLLWFFFSAVLTSFMPAKNSAQRQALRRKFGYTHSTITFAATEYGITTFARGDDGECSFSEHTWFPGSTVTVDGDKVQCLTEYMYHVMSVPIPRKYLGEWEGELKRICETSKNIERDPARGLYESDLLGKMELDSSDHPVTFSYATPFTPWYVKFLQRSATVTPFAVLFLIYSVLVGPLFAKHWLFGWTHPPGGYLPMVIPFILAVLFARRMYVRNRPKQNRPYEAVVDLLDDRIWTKTQFYTNSYVSNVFKWHWNWELHANKTGVRLFAPEISFAVVLYKGKMPDDQLAQVKEFVKARGCTLKC